MKLPLLLSICLLSMLLVGCPGPVMEVKVADASAKHLSLELLTHDNLLGTTYPQKVSRFSFYKKSVKKGDMDIIWSAESQEKDSRQLTKIIYGETPAGFDATTPQPLFPGDNIYVSFHSKDHDISTSLGTVEFTVR